MSLRSSGAAAAADAGVGAAVFVEELGKAFEHDAAQLLGVDDRHGAAVIAGHVMADADRGEFHLAEALDVVDHLALLVFDLRNERGVSRASHLYGQTATCRYYP